MVVSKVLGNSPPPIIPLVELATQNTPEIALVMSPKSNALPNVPIETKSMVLTRDGASPAAKQQRVGFEKADACVLF